MSASRRLVLALVITALAVSAGCASKSRQGGTSGAPSTAATATATTTQSVTPTGSAAATVSTNPAGPGTSGATGGSASKPGGSKTSGSQGQGGITPKPGENPEENLGTNVLVYVSTIAKKRPPAGTEIVLGKSSFKPDTQRAMDRGVLGPLPAGKTATLVIYPDGRDGKKISIPILVSGSNTKDPRGRTVDVAISDEGVTVLGVMVQPEGRGTKDRF